MANHTAAMARLVTAAVVAEQDTQRFPSAHVCRSALRSVYITGIDSSRRIFWETYEFYEERIMLYIQVVSTSSREMACDNRNMTLGRSA